MKRYVYISLAATLLASCAIFKGGKKAKAKKAAATAAAAAAKPAAPVSKNGVKPYATVISKNLITKQGLFTVIHSKEMDSVFFELGDSLLGRDIMVINRLTGAPGGMNVHAGEELDNNTIFFEKGPNETLRIRYNIVGADADSTDRIYRSVQNSNVNPVVVSFPIKAYGKDSASYVIDVSRFLKDPASMVHSLEKGQISGLDPKTLKEHEILTLRAYPLNVEIATSKNGNFKTLFAKNPAPITIETNTSFILLPEKPMQRRFADERVGYFTDWVQEFGDHQQKAKTREFLNRWRLEPKPADMEKYKRGELVEPVKPIVLYIDPATPKQWRKYLILGVNDWQVAFEKAGFKNAIIAKEWPENDTTMHMEDARYSFINYFASPVANAYGPNIHDTRSGEIIQTHIGWYHNVMSLLRNWYMIQGGPNDAGARKAVFDEELMGQLIRFVSSHEVGHTLGLRHNFGSSSMTPTDSLRSKTYLARHGHTASIMDYARFNYVAQPEDNIPRELLFPRIAEYDQWAIEWGYKYTGAATAAEDHKIMAKLATTRLAANPRLWFGDGETRKSDPRCQTEDLGDDVAKSNALGIKNLRRVLAGLPQWTLEENGLNEELKEMYGEVKNQYFRYVNHVIRFAGTTQFTIRNSGDTRPAYEPIPREKQLAALKFLETEVFTTPDWILDAKVTSMTEDAASKDFVTDLQEKVVNSLLDGARLNFVLMNEARFGKQALGFDEYLGRVRNAVWQPVMQGSGKTDIYQRNMQRNYLGAMLAIVGSPDPAAAETEAAARISAEIVVLKKIIDGGISRTSDPATKMHLQSLAQKIKQLDAKKA